MNIISRLRNSFFTFKKSKPKFYKWFLIILSSILFLGILPYDKSFLTLYNSEKIGTIISYVFTGITAFIAVFSFIFFKKDKTKIFLLFGLGFTFILIGFGWLVGSLLTNSLEFSRVLSLGCFFIYYVYVINCFDDKDDLIFSLIITTLFLIISSLVLYILKNPNVIYTERAHVFRFKGVASNRNSYIELSLFPFVFLLYFALKSKSWVNRICYCCVAIIPLVSTILTYSITAIIIFAVATILIILKKWSYYFTNFYIVLLLSILIFVLALYSKNMKFLDWFYELVNKSSTLTGRSTLWFKTFDLVKDELVFGHGFDNDVLIREGFKYNDPHNGYLYLLLTQGIFGLLIFIFILFIAIRKDKGKNLLYTISSIFVASWMYRSVVESGLSYSHFVFWTVIILLIRIRLETEHKFPPIPKALKKDKQLNEESRDIKRASNNTTMLYLHTIAKLVFPLITLPYLTRVLSKDVYGTVSYVKALMSYVQLVIDFGFIYSAVKDIVKINGKKEETDRIISNTVFAKLFLAVCSFVVVLILALTLPILKGNMLFVVLSFGTPLLSIFLFDFLFKGIEKMHFTTISFVVIKLLSTLLVFLFVKNDSDIVLIPLFDIAGSLIAVAISVFAMIKNGYSFKKPSFSESFKALKVSSTYFVNVIASTAFGIMLTLLIGIFIPNGTEISYWAVSMQLVGAVQAFYTPISDGIYPYMIRRKNLKIIKIILLIVLPIVTLGSLFCFFYSDLIIGLVSGAEYIEGAYVFKALAPVLLLSFPVSILGWPVFGAINKPKQLSISTIIGAAVQLASFLFLLIIGQMNLLAIAITRCISEATMLIIRIVFVYKNRHEFNKNGGDEKMKKAGIITHYNVHNHGAQLQLYALSRVLLEEGIEAKALQFKKNYDFMDQDEADKKYTFSIKSIPYFVKYSFKKGIFRTIFNIRKRKMLNHFRNKYSLNGEYYSQAKDLDLVVVGSDEIFSIEAGINPWYFGIGVQCQHQFSYAASFGPTTYSDIENHNLLGFIKSGLNNLNNISVRDENSQQIVNKLINKDVPIVCDPVILFDYKKYIDEKDIEENKENTVNKYCLVYSYDDHLNDKETVRAIKNYAKQHKLSIISVGYYHRWCSSNINVDPLDLFKWFSCAEIVFTDTFHGTVLSLLTNRDFVCKINNNQNKLVDLLDQYNLLDRKVDDFSKCEFDKLDKIDYSKVNQIIEKKRTESREILRKYIKES